MTIVVTVKVTDGLVLAADSASTFYVPTGVALVTKIYNHANKIFNLRKVWPVGAMVYGAGGIGASSVETLSKDLRRRFSDEKDDAYYLHKKTYTIEDVAKKARQFLFEETYRKTYGDEPQPNFNMGYRVAAILQMLICQKFGILITRGNCDPPYQVQAQDEFGLRWAGETEALDRLILGVTPALMNWFIQKGLVQAADSNTLYLEVVNHLSGPLVLPAMPIQDAINLARFAVETAAGYAKYRMRHEWIGGPIELAAITKHEGFKWVARKHYYTKELNRETDHGRDEEGDDDVPRSV